MPLSNEACQNNEGETILIEAGSTCSLLAKEAAKKRGVTGIPDSVHETAKIDGASIVKIFTSVMLPLSASSFIVVGIFQFTNI
ncbi:ABC transporter, Permease [Candidatus Moduliflexus flocculans]|uniref:ABC transporter, Permease n=1 Tax=Candidatus Moduliflexus flocculans TaxID=1499966 RepID=A0A0S6VW55_9BACT|nr:ABC transporter, Permease [Candidatus Moduliflexus flocculans]